MAHLQDLSNQIRQILFDTDFDLRIETLLEEFLDLLMHNPNLIIIRSKGAFLRGYSNDILDIFVDKFLHETLFIDISRDGIRNRLPELLFFSDYISESHLPISKDFSNEKIKEDVNRFFLPLENEFYFFRIFLERSNQAGFPKVRIHNASSILEEFFGSYKYLRDVAVASNISPFVHRIVGDISQTEKCFESIMDAPVTIIKGPPVTFRVEDYTRDALGKISLDDNFILVGKFSNLLPNLVIQIGPISKKQISCYLDPKGEIQNDLFKVLCRYLLPFEVDYSVDFIIDSDDQGFCLDDNCRLKYTSYI